MGGHNTGASWSPVSTAVGIPSDLQNIVSPITHVHVQVIEPACFLVPEGNITRGSPEHGNKFFSLIDDSQSYVSGTSDAVEDILSGSLNLTETSSDNEEEEQCTVKRRKYHGKKSNQCEMERLANVWNSPELAKTLKWDYSATSLMYPEDARSRSDPSSQDSVQQSPLEKGEPTLSLIYKSIKQKKEEARSESCRAQLDNKKVQGALMKVNKACSETVPGSPAWKNEQWYWNKTLGDCKVKLSNSKPISLILCGKWRTLKTATPE
ncbi:hypothetical protein NDU88_004251 [Pleurodeles waltl]|uniref:Uncharacterized protein n=1 Tax=Pleurodeles waltl TaxID=8319 RepID=A0AAV7M6K3_PLEWA|nr:hypothetical protein NDU88_004251 [Pleurodeles waltl]